MKVTFRLLTCFDKAGDVWNCATAFFFFFGVGGCGTNKCFKATITFVGFPDPAMVFHNSHSGREETNFPLFLHLDNHSQWTQHISTLFATPTPRSARFACSTDGGKTWIAFIGQSGAEVSFNFDKRWAGNICFTQNRVGYKGARRANGAVATANKLLSFRFQMYFGSVHKPG